MADEIPGCSFVFKRSDEVPTGSKETGTDFFCWSDSDGDIQPYLLSNSNTTESTKMTSTNVSKENDTKLATMEERLYKIETDVCSIKEMNIDIQKTQRSILREIVVLKHLMLNEQQDSNQLDNPSVELPCKSVADFEKLEENCRNDKKTEKYLTHKYNDISKFVKRNLQAIVTDKAATNFSWFGHQKNIPIKGYLTIKLLKDTTLMKFKDASEDEVTQLIKKWFQLAKDRERKRLIKNTDGQ